MHQLKRRGFNLGSTLKVSPSKPIDRDHNQLYEEKWSRGIPVKLVDLCDSKIEQYKPKIEKTELLVLNILEEKPVEELLLEPPYINQTKDRFSSLGTVFNEGDDQEIETVLFDQILGNSILHEDLWMKVSWLSFYDNDVSIRFRFSFGTDLVEDVAADPGRQKASADLAEAIFPESAIITANGQLIDFIKKLTGKKAPEFVERIIYFNAPRGGAYLHHDVERGHLGVVYAQISGSTFWLALPQYELVNEIIEFLDSNNWPSSLDAKARESLSQLQNDPILISQALNSFAHNELIHLINETEEFTQHLIKKGHSQTLEAGDVILLPQKDQNTFCWHSVFCLGEEMGQALSFAIK